MAALESAKIALDHRRRFGPDWRADIAAVDAISKRVEDVGEAASRVSRELMARHPEVPWALIAGMRHRLVHAYAHRDLEVIADVVERHIPALIERLSDLLRSEVPPRSADSV